ncbi:MAG: hypothetical protein V3R52_06635 [Candidatus Neomarinimicrobiota bacterium]
MKYFSFLLLVLFVGCQTNDVSSSLTIQTDIDTTVARIGDIINLNITSQNTGDRILIFPDIQETDSMEIRGKKLVRKRNNSYRVNFQIVFWDTGSFQIPSIPIVVMKADSVRDLIIETDPIDIKIISMLTGAEDTNLRPIKDPVALKNPINWYRFILIMLLIILLFVFLILWRKRIKQEPLTKIEASEYQSAKDIAIARLIELQKLLHSKNKIFYLQASFILREFIENEYYIRALEMTTGEISKFETNTDLGEYNFNSVIDLLTRADLAKFAKYEFTIQDREDDYNWIKDFIANFDDK